MSKKFTASDIVILASAVVLLIASFLTWIDFGSPRFPISQQALQQLGVDIPRGTENAWDHFPGFVYPLIAGVIAGVQVVMEKVRPQMPGHVAGFSWTQIDLLLGIWALLSVIAVAFEDFGYGDKGIGLWLTLIAAAGLLVGAILRLREPARVTAEPSAA
ncbi:MAG TPA: hypothetical protein VGS60_12105 [Actinomycetes bacterium]|nr:hypothetical protein [Actinomycetes bacterium]